MDEPLTPEARKEWLEQFGKDLESGRRRLLGTAIDGLAKLGREDLIEMVLKIFQEREPNPDTINQLIGAISSNTRVVPVS